jgi:hypothetical protein
MRYFFGIPFNYEYNFLHLKDTVEKALERRLGYKIAFVCNTVIYNGDAYMIDQNITEEEFCFLKITHGFDLIPTEVAEQYISDYKTKYRNPHKLDKTCLLNRRTVGQEVTLPDLEYGEMPAEGAKQWAD